MKRYIAPVLASLVLPTALFLVVANPAAGQTDSYDAYLNYENFTEALQNIATAHKDLCTLESLGRTGENREIWIVTIGNPNNGNRSTNPAMLVVANLEANHIIGSMAALYLIDYLLSGYGTNNAITDLLNTRTVYVVPRVNPDGAERFWTLRAMEIPYKPNPEDEDRDGVADEDPGDDLNRDGFITTMRVRDPDGIWIVDPDEPRLLRQADRTKGERGIYRLYTEGRDNDGDGEYNEDGPGGTHLNMNWPHQYPHYQNHAGIHQVSEVETRALADFAFTHPNLAMVLTFSPYDNLLNAPQARAMREAPPNIPEGLELPPGINLEDVADFFRERVAPTAILPQDGPYFNFISEKFREITGLNGKGAAGEGGSWSQFAYYQMGLPSFTTPVWTLPEADPAAPSGAMSGGAESSMTASRSRSGPESDDSKWLRWFDDNGIQGFVDWTPVSHPTLGDVEVGGFIPNIKINPPPKRIADLCGRHARFAVWLGSQTALVTLVNTEVEARGEGVFRIEATVQNDSYLPTALSMGLRTRAVEPVLLRLLPAAGMNVVSGNIQQQVRVLNGSGDRSTHSWLVTAPPGTRVTLEMLAARSGGLTTLTLYLR